MLETGDNENGEENTPVKLSRWQKTKKVTKVSLALLCAHYTLSKIDSAYWYNVPTTILPDIESREKINIDGQLNDRRFSESQLENKIKIEFKGIFDPDTVEKLASVYFQLEKEDVPMRSAAKTVTITPSSIVKDYSGLAIPHGKMILSSNVSQATIFHEFGHLHAFKQDDDFWLKWEQVSRGSYRHNTLKGATTIVERFTGTPRNSKFKPRDGILTHYGCTNIHEDIAEFVEDCYTGYESLMKVKPGEEKKYLTKIELLKKHGFISDERAKKAKLSIGLMSNEGIEKIAMDYLSNVDHAKIHGGTFSGYGSNFILAPDLETNFYTVSLRYCSGIRSQYLSLSVRTETGVTESFEIPSNHSEKRLSSNGFEKPREVPEKVYSIMKNKGYLNEDFKSLVVQYSTLDNQKEMEDIKRNGHKVIGFFDFMDGESFPSKKISVCVYMLKGHQKSEN